jgi:hypothetical protein
MNPKIKVPSYNKSFIIIDKTLNGKIETLDNNSEYQELHGKLRSILSKSAHLSLK